MVKLSFRLQSLNFSHYSCPSSAWWSEDGILRSPGVHGEKLHPPRRRGGVPEDAEDGVLPPRVLHLPRPDEPHHAGDAETELLTLQAQYVQCSMYQSCWLLVTVSMATRAAGS